MRIIGHVDDLCMFSLSGWAADIDDMGNPLTVTVLVDGVVVGNQIADVYREGLEDLAPGASGRHAFHFYFDEPLSPFRHYQVSVSAGPDGDVLAPGALTARPIEPTAAASPPRPLRPILLTTMGRSGSTLLMSILAAQSAIVVGDEHPFEIELLTYYAHALRTLIARGDHRRSLRPDRITAAENRFAIGFNPFLESGFRLRFRDPARFDHFAKAVLPDHLTAAFQGAIIDFYNVVAADQAKAEPTYFAEKALPDDLIRGTARWMFGTVKEIVLVRDPRDVLCSCMHHGRIDVDVALPSVMSSTLQIAAIPENADTCFVRYEDLVRQPTPTLHRIREFLGLADEFRYAGQHDLFRLHATSENPLASIGRWKRELHADVLDRCRGLEPMLRRFDYAPARLARIFSFAAKASGESGGCHVAQPHRVAL